MKKLFLAIILFFLFFGCTAVNKKNLLFQSEKLNTDKSVIELVYGNWMPGKIMGYSMIHAMDSKDIDRFSEVYPEYTYTDKSFVAGNETIIDPLYSVTVINADKFSQVYMASFRQLGISEKTIRSVSVYNQKGTQVNSPGALIFISEKGKIFSLWDGCFYELKRMKGK